MIDVLELNKRYKIIYDDKGFKPVSKFGTIVSKEGNLIRMDNGEVLNTLLIIRVEEQNGLRG